MLLSRTKISLFFIIGFFFLLLPPNLTGAKDKNMLAAFDVDEYAQYEVLTRMTTGAPTIGETLSSFFVYNYYAYGYPFFLSSALVAVPAKFIALAFGAHDATPYLIALLRQLGGFFIAFSLVLLCQTTVPRRRNFLFLGLLFSLALVPSVIEISTLWHPDHLVTLFVIATLYALNRDHLRLKKWFYWAAFFCGFATGTKLYGLFFFMTIASYLLLAYFYRGLTVRDVIVAGRNFVLLMISAVIISNPLLIMPDYSNEVIKGFFGLLAWHSDVEAAISSPSTFSRINLWYVQSIQNHFGFWWLYLTTIALLGWVAFKETQLRVKIMIFLTWVLPIGFYVLFRVTHTTHYRYFIPILLPLLATWGLIIPALPKILPRPVYSAMAVVLSFAFVTQISSFVSNIHSSYSKTLNREKESKAVSFHNQTGQNIIKMLSTAKKSKVVIFRDPWIYVRPQENLDIRMKWGKADYSDIKNIDPDLIILQTGYFDPDSENLPLVPNSSSMFYLDAKRNHIKGYIQVARSDYAVAFVSTRFKKYLPTRP